LRKNPDWEDLPLLGEESLAQPPDNSYVEWKLNFKTTIMAIYATLYLPNDDEELLTFLSKDNYFGEVVQKFLQSRNTSFSKPEHLMLNVTAVAFSRIKGSERIPVYNFEANKDIELLLIKNILPTKNSIMEPNQSLLRWLKTIAIQFKAVVKVELTHERGDTIYDEYTWKFNYRPEANPVEILSLDYDDYTDGTNFGLYRDGRVVQYY
jgi:hypothetical protein